MELEDLKNRWADYDRKLDRSLRLNTLALREATAGRVDSSLRRLTRLLWFELLTTLPLVFLLGRFVADHLREARFLVPGLALGLGALGLALSAIHQLNALATLDLGAPVVEIQKRLERLRIWRIRTTQWTLLLSPLLWVPMLVVALEGLIGLDAYRIFDTAWLIGNLLFGVAFLLLMVWVSRRFADRLHRSPLVQSLLDDFAGRSLVAATGFLGALRRFEEE
jgi:hypothetical protein